MRRIFLNGFFIVILFVLQSTLFQWLALANVSPNLLLILTVSCGLIHGKNEGMLTGFFCGLLLDVFFADVVGFHALIYMGMGYLSGIFNAIFFEDDVKLPMILMFASELLYGIVIYVFRFLLRNRLSFGYYFLHVIIPELMYTIVVMIVLYRIILGVSRFVDRIGKRGEGQIVE